MLCISTIPTQEICECMFEHKKYARVRIFGGVYRYPEYFWWAYRTYRSGEYRTELTEVLSTVPNLPKCWVPVSRVSMLGGVCRYPGYFWWAYRTYRSGEYRTELTEVLSTVPNLPKCWVPVSRVSVLGGVYRYPGYFWVGVPNTPKF